MKIALVIVLLSVAAAMAAPKRRIAPLYPNNPNANTIPDQYIVVFEREASEDDVQKHKEIVTGMLAQLNGTYCMKDHYHIGNFRGYSSEMDARTLEHVREMREVAYVDRNEVMKAFQGNNCERQTNDVPWGLARIQSVDLPRQAEFIYSKQDGEGVTAYIIDTGIDTEHPGFGGRATCGFDYFDTSCNSLDPNGHGTHVAGTVMGDMYGIARGATSVAVRVLNGGGSGTTAGVIAGINYVGRDGRGKKSVANMSLGGGRSQSLNDAVEAAAEGDEGVHFVVAAGNEGQDACNVSPASALVIATAASDDEDKPAYFTNYGDCVEIIAPGVNVKSLWPGGGTNTISGTSMAAPHVAGVMAKILSERDLSPKEMEAYLKQTASKDKIPNYRGDNDLLYVAPCES